MNKCLVCGKEVKDNRRKYCCHECFAIDLSRRTKGKPKRQYEQRYCETCGKQLSRNQLKTKNKYCSLECANKAHTIKDYVVCKNCGKEYLPKSVERTTFCSRECAFEYKTNNKKSKKLKEPTIYQRECANCGKAFETMYGDKKYCSILCRVEAQKKRTPEKPPTEYKKVCQECGGTFTTTQSGRIYCGEDCAKRHDNRHKELNRRHKIRENGHADYSISLERLAKRDQCTCHICGGKVDMSADTNSDTYGSIDHVIPISKGGTHTWDNVRLAHRLCNTIKSNDSLYQIVAGQVMMCG